MFLLFFYAHLYPVSWSGENGHSDRLLYDETLPTDCCGGHCLDTDLSTRIHHRASAELCGRVGVTSVKDSVYYSLILNPLDNSVLMHRIRAALQRDWRCWERKQTWVEKCGSYTDTVPLGREWCLPEMLCWVKTQQSFQSRPLLCQAR